MSNDTKRQKARERQKRYASKPEVRARILQQRKEQRARRQVVIDIEEAPWYGPRGDAPVITPVEIDVDYSHA
jgi:hypothetical protein